MRHRVEGGDRAATAHHQRRRRHSSPPAASHRRANGARWRAEGVDVAHARGSRPCGLSRDTRPSIRAQQAPDLPGWRRPTGRCWVEVRDSPNRSLRGWSTYFCCGTRGAAFRSIDHYVTERVRAFLARRHKGAGWRSRPGNWSRNPSGDHGWPKGAAVRAVAPTPRAKDVLQVGMLAEVNRTVTWRVARRCAEDCACNRSGNQVLEMNVRRKTTKTMEATDGW